MDTPAFWANRSIQVLENVAFYVIGELVSGVPKGAHLLLKDTSDIFDVTESRWTEDTSADPEAKSGVLH